MSSRAEDGAQLSQHSPPENTMLPLKVEENIFSIQFPSLTRHENKRVSQNVF